MYLSVRQDSRRIMAWDQREITQSTSLGGLLAARNYQFLLLNTICATKPIKGSLRGRQRKLLLTCQMAGLTGYVAEFEK